MRTVLARFALGVAILIAGWALVDAVTSRWSMSAGTRGETSADVAKSEPPVVAFADPEPSKKSPSSRRAAKRSPDPNAGEFIHANTPVVIPPGASEIGFEPPRETAAQGESRPAPSRTEREGIAPGAPASAQEPPPAPGRVAPESPVGAPATAEDEAITLEVRRKIEGAAPGRRIQVTTRNRVVTLSGAVDTEQQKAEVLDAVRRTPGVERVEDRLVVLVS